MRRNGNTGKVLKKKKKKKKKDSFLTTRTKQNGFCGKNKAT